ncbi:hypothetical protein CU669_12465 [Paramagnetospirillum kuznetsovii]|uniref:histidine kinase n=1 Tax=Paramagnetospirillum kuznetsovii TaxID=2053833 RepID=A0A364NWN7_9PROT|nr:ATP-binding protein [Paramagnetospirillum kuznetsovii]RAU21509.1 hypothetical protein CU669_12465 [Paramagnetospirillum kuznetsovii]
MKPGSPHTKTKAQLEADVLVLTREVEALRRRLDSGPDDSRRLMTETLHSLQVHQEELRTQNEELRQAHDSIAKISDRYRTLFEYSPVGYFIIDENFTVVDANIAAMSLLGRTKSRISSKPFLLFVDKGERHLLDDHFRAVRTGVRATTEVSLISDHRPPLPVILESVHLGNEDGGGWRCLTTATDISDRKHAEIALRESETRFRAIFEQSPLAMRIVDSNSKPRMSNRAWVKLWGDSPVGSGLSELLPDGLAGQSLEIPAVHVDSENGGGERWLHGYVYPIHGDETSVPEVVLVHEDITERKRMEMALAERSELLRRQYENLRALSEIAALPTPYVGMRLTDALGLARRHLGLFMGMISRVEGTRFTVEHHSAAMEEGATPDGTIFDLPNTYCALAIDHDDVIAISHMAQSPFADHPCYRTHGLETYIGVPIRVRGKVYGTVSFSSPRPIDRNFDDGDREFVRLLGRWVSAVLEEESVRRDLAQSNAELEQFAYVASHDLRQPLRQVSSYVSLLARRYADKLDADAREFIAFAHDGAVRMDRLIVDLLEFSRIGRGDKPMEPVALTDIMAEALAVLRHAITEANGRVDLQSSLPTLKGNASDLVRLFQNLIGNALKYRLPERNPIVSISAESGPMSHVITIRDNGIGIEGIYHGTIFGVFKRLHTPDKFEGTGIGLAICKKVIDQHNGRIWVESVPGKGSAFHVELPSGL